MNRWPTYWHSENDMNTEQDWQAQDTDPLGLRDLPMVTPDTDGWPAIEAALLAAQETGRKRRHAAVWLAAAASLVLVVSLSMRLTGPGETGPGPAAEMAAVAQGQDDTPADSGNAVGELITMSQTLERQLRSLREDTGTMPADSAVYVAELEDLVAQVDTELSFSPRSINLWGQRVNLLLDLAQIYQHQWEREYGRMASL